MDFGQLDRRIAIQRNSPTQDDYGEPIVSWSDLAVVWAQVTPVSGAERFTGETIDATRRSRFLIRHRTDVKPDMRISWDSLVWDIAEVHEVGRGEATEIVAEAKAA